MSAPSLRLRLAASLTLTTLLVALVAGIAAYHAIHDEAHDYQDDILRQTALLIDPNNPPPRADLDDDNRIDIETVSRTGRYGRFLGKKPGDGYHDLRRHDRPYRAYLHTYPDGQRLALIQDTESRDQIASASAWHAILPLLLLVPILALTSLYTIHRALRPVRRLTRDIEARTENDLSPLATDGVPQEMRGIIHATNRLLTRIDATLRHEKRFIADAAHELRTPMTALTLQAERLAPYTNDPAARAQLDTLRTGIRRTAALLEQLLLLARSQHAETTAPATSRLSFARLSKPCCRLPTPNRATSASPVTPTPPCPSPPPNSIPSSKTSPTTPCATARPAAASTLTSKPTPTPSPSSLKTTAPASRQTNARASSTPSTASLAAKKKAPASALPSSKACATNTARHSACTTPKTTRTACG